MSSRKLADLEPKIIWTLFEDITHVPRPSKKEQKIRKWLLEWAKDNNLKAKEDKTGNICISCPPSKGFEDYPTLVLQAHMDMVCQSDDPSFDFDNNPIPVAHDDKYVFAEGTSLGADNGIGVAYSLATMIDPDLKHGPLEAVLTVDEETGLTGAFNMEKGFFTGKYLLNVDSEDEGEITISSAGGGGTKVTIPLEYEQLTSSDHSVIKFKISGLKGGHSGVDINLPRANAIKVLVSLLSSLVDIQQENDIGYFAIVDIKGGNAHNAIPRSSEVTIAVNKHELSAIKKHAKKWFKEAKNEIKEYEPDISFEIEEPNEKTNKAIIKDKTLAIIEILDNIHHGVISYNKDIKDLVQTSNNLATVEKKDDKIEINVSTRSSVNEELEKARQTIKELSEIRGAKVELDEAYPGWEPNLDSPFLKLVHESYETVAQSKVELKAIHAGLECSLFLKLDPELEVSSIGPNIYNPHSPQEKVEIQSVGNVWKVVKEIIRNMNKLPKK